MTVGTLLVALALTQPPTNPPAPPKVEVVPEREALPAEEIKVKVGVPVTLKTDRPCKYEPCDEAKVKVVRDPSGLRATIVVPQAGRFKLFVYAADAADPTVKLLVTDGTPAPPPGPVDPPTPPPAPPPAPPADEVKDKLLAAHKEDGPESANKADNRKRLVAMYRFAADKSADPGILTAAELLRRVKEGAKDVTADTLPKTRQAAAEVLNARLPTGPGEALTFDTRKAAANLFAKFADVLDGVK